MDQVQEDKLKELYGKFGEVVLKLEYFQAKYMELKNQILAATQGNPK